MPDFETRSPVAIRDGMLRVIRNLFREKGIEANVTPGSDWFILAEAVSVEVSPIEASLADIIDEVMPDTAVGEQLARWARPFIGDKQPSTGSVGGGTISTSATTIVPTGAELLDDAGLRYKVTSGGSYGDGATIPIAAVDTGEGTNLEEGAVLRFVAAPPFADEKVIVSGGGFGNGVNEEDDEDYRARLVAYWADPPAAGNPEDVAETAERATNSVQKAFVYPAVEGPGTEHVAVVAAPTETKKSRVVEALTVTGIIHPYLEGHLARQGYRVTTSVTDVPVDIAFGISVPDAPTANLPGPGGGWTDGLPWPSPNGISGFYSRVNTVTSPTEFYVENGVADNLKGRRVSWLSPKNWKIYSATIHWVELPQKIYLDQPFPEIEEGAYIWPEFAQSETLVNAVLAAFARMGPGEKTANIMALKRGYRHPPPAQGWVAGIGPGMLRAVSNASEDVLDITYLHRTDGTTTLTGPAGLLVPQVPASVEDPPKIYVPRHIGFYRIQ